MICTEWIASSSNQDQESLQCLFKPPQHLARFPRAISPGALCCCHASSYRHTLYTWLPTKTVVRARQLTLSQPSSFCQCSSLKPNASYQNCTLRWLVTRPFPRSQRLYGHAHPVEACGTPKTSTNKMSTVQWKHPSAASRNRWCEVAAFS